MRSILGGALAELSNEKSVRIIFIRKDFQYTVANDGACGKGAEGKFRMRGKEILHDLAVFRRIDRTGRIDERSTRFQISGIGFQNFCLQNGETDDVFLGFVTDIGLFRDNAESGARHVAKDLVKNGHFGIGQYLPYR